MNPPELPPGTPWSYSREGDNAPGYAKNPTLTSNSPQQDEIISVQSLRPADELEPEQFQNNFVESTTEVIDDIILALVTPRLAHYEIAERLPTEASPTKLKNYQESIFKNLISQLNAMAHRHYQILAQHPEWSGFVTMDWEAEYKERFERVTEVDKFLEGYDTNKIKMLNSQVRAMILKIGGEVEVLERRQAMLEYEKAQSQAILVAKRRAKDSLDG